MKNIFHSIHARVGDLWWYTALLFVAQRFGDVINMFVGMWLVPHYVPQEELGAVLPLMQFVGFFALPLSIVTIPFMKFITVFIDNGEDGKAKAFICDVFAAVAVLAVLTIPMAYLLMPMVFSRLHVACGSLGFLVIAVAVIGATSSVFGYAIQGFRMYAVTIWTQVIQAPLRLVMMLVAMPFRALSGYMVGQTAGPITQIAAAMIAFRRRFGKMVKPMPYWDEYKGAIIRYTLPFAIWSIAGTITGSFDTLVVRHRLPKFESAGYYMLTRFTDIAGYLGLAAAGFLFPMVASRKASDRGGRKLLWQSVSCAVVGGGVVVVLLTVMGGWLFGLVPEWRAYVSMTHLFPLAGAFTVCATVTGCFITYETAQGRFRFMWYVLPIHAVRTVFLYAVTGYTFFEGMVAQPILEKIASWQPCRLSFFFSVLLVGQLMVVLGLLADVLLLGRCEGNLCQSLRGIE